MDIKNFNSLENRIYETCKSRIQASERLKQWDSFFVKINVYYSLLVVVLSIWNLKNPSNNNASLALLILSVVTFSFTIFISSLNCKERSLSFKNNYISLGKLYIELKSLSDKPKDATYDENLHDIGVDYQELLESTDNHETIDYYTSIYNDKEKFLNLLKYNKDKYDLIKKKVENGKKFNFILNTIIIIAPALLPLFVKLIDFYIYCLN